MMNNKKGFNDIVFIEHKDQLTPPPPPKKKTNSEELKQKFKLLINRKGGQQATINFRICALNVYRALKSLDNTERSQKLLNDFFLKELGLAVDKQILKKIKEEQKNNR